MVKRIFILLCIIFSYISSSHAANYTNIASDNDHLELWNIVWNAISNYLDSHWNTVDTNNLNELRDIVNQTIASSGWWDWTTRSTSSEQYQQLAYISWGSLIVWCWNENLAAFNVNVVSYWSSTQWWCSQYISWWNTSWSDCSVSWTWDSNWNIQCVQTPSYSPNYSSCGSQNCTTTYYNGQPTWTSCEPCSWCPWDAGQPNYSPTSRTITANLSSVTWNCGSWIYANNSDSCNILLSIGASTVDNRNITWWWSNWAVSNITDNSWEKSDRIQNTWVALNFSSVSSNTIANTTWNNFTVSINWIRSTTPFSSTNWKIWIKLWNTPLELSNVNYNFRKPFIWALSSWDTSSSSWNWAPTIWTTNNFKLYLVQKSTITPSALNWYYIEDFSSKVSSVGSGSIVQTPDVDNTTVNNTAGTTFSARLNTSSWARSLEPNPWIKVTTPIIRYNLWWQNVSYYLTSWDSANDSSAITTNWASFAWIKVLWTSQSSGKADITMQTTNNSNLYPSNLRTPLRKNAYNFIKDLRSWDVFNKVKYVEWDITIFWNQSADIETLVVKNWNVTISSDFNTENKIFWIIVLKDSYDLNNWFNGKWNVYIMPDVQKVNAAIYADGWIISVQENWSPFQTDSSDRSNKLNKQLILNWSFFTRNTIWWSIFSWGNYILPGWGKTSNFDLAMQYDLNYLRRWNSWCDTNWNWNCTDTWENREPVIIKYNSKLQSTPPKLFSF